MISHGILELGRQFPNGQRVGGECGMVRAQNEPFGL